ncbi:MAG TPA: NAD(P)H-binding protein [Vicinamibacteria bacterium]
MKGTTLIVGGTGKTGRRVAERLQAKGVPVRIGSRSANPPFDWEDPKTWEPAVRGVTAAYVTYYPDLAVPGAAEKVKAFSEVAVKNGVSRLVLLSGRGEDGAMLGEQAVQASGAQWTILRCGWFDQNFSEGFFRDQVMSGEVALPGGDVKEPFVDTDDIADVAVAALTEDRHVGQLYEITGPRLLTFREAVAEVARATGREIRYVPVSMEQYKAMLEEYQVPADFIWLVNYLFTEVLDGRNAHQSDGVERALGRKPRDFSEYARDAAAAGAWSQA